MNCGGYRGLSTSPLRCGGGSRSLGSPGRAHRIVDLCYVGFSENDESSDLDVRPIILNQNSMEGGGAITDDPSLAGGRIDEKWLVAHDPFRVVLPSGAYGTARKCPVRRECDRIIPAHGRSGSGSGQGCHSSHCPPECVRAV